MSRIQIVRRTVKNKFDNSVIVYSSIDNPKALDDFDINIIDLNDNQLWTNHNNNNVESDYDNDYVSLSKLIASRKKAKVIILLPENYTFTYNYWNSERRYRSGILLKDMITQMMGIIGRLTWSINSCELIFENTVTDICGLEAKAAFSFETYSADEITCSKISERKTTICSDEIILSTLCLENEEIIIAFLKEIGLIKENETAPQWFSNIDMFDDIERKNEINNIETQIKKLEDKKNMNLAVLKQNDKYKSILYTSGKELVIVIFEIFEEMLGCDLSEFVDVNKEDFLFEIDNKVYMGEIKGVNSNVRSEYVSQLDVHVNGYLDEHPEKTLDDIVALLVINDQKKKIPQEREGVHENQIALAKRNGSLIIRTQRLLDIFSKYRNGDINRAEVIEMLNQRGLL